MWGGNETQDLEVLDSVSYLLRGESETGPVDHFEVCTCTRVYMLKYALGDVHTCLSCCLGN